MRVKDRKADIFALKSKDKRKDRLEKKEKILWYLLAGAICFSLTWIFFESLIVGLFLLPILIFLEPRVATEVRNHKMRGWEMEFSKYLTNLDSSIRLGHSLETAMVEAAKENTLFGKESWMIKELEMNVYIADIFRKLAEEKNMESIRHFASALESAIHSGSNLHELILNNIFQIQKKIRMEIEIRSMLTKIRYESGMLVGFVPFTLLYLKGLSPNFQKVMYGTLQGKTVMLLCMGIYLTASYLCYAMSQVEI